MPILKSHVAINGRGFLCCVCIAKVITFEGMAILGYDYIIKQLAEAGAIVAIHGYSDCDMIVGHQSAMPNGTEA